MAITSGAKKALRVSKRKRVFNLRRARAMKEMVKSFRDFVRAKDYPAAGKIFPVVYQALDKAAKRGVIKKKTASRKKSRLSHLLRNG